MNNQMIGIVISLIIGIGLGHMIWFLNPKISNAPLMHQMPDGSVMANGTMQNAMNGMMAGLEDKTGDAFDEAFISEMILHHQGAVEMAQIALSNAKHQEIKDLSNAIISAQTKEIGMMQQWQNQWYR
jgi:uncharacterized protein (DUF305 family)